MLKTGKEYKILGQIFSNSFKKRHFQTIVDRFYFGFHYISVSLAPTLSQSSLCERAVKPGSHRKIVKDYRPKTGKNQEILGESG